MNQKFSLVLVVLLAIAAFLAGSFWTKLRSLEKGQVTSTSTISSAPAQPLSIDNLKKYASDLGLNKDQFNQCLDGGQKAQIVASDINQGNTLGVTATPTFFINGRFVGGAFPFEAFKEIIDKEISGNGSSSPTAYSQSLQDAAKAKAFNPKPVDIKVSSTDFVTGPSEAKVTMVEFSDFQCPYCARAYPVIKQILRAYPKDVRFVYKQYPLTSIHTFAQKASEASLCAGEQGKFWEYHDKLFESQGTGQ